MKERVREREREREGGRKGKRERVGEGRKNWAHWCASNEGNWVAFQTVWEGAFPLGALWNVLNLYYIYALTVCLHNYSTNFVLLINQSHCISVSSIREFLSHVLSAYIRQLWHLALGRNREPQASIWGVLGWLGLGLSILAFALFCTL